MMYPKNNPKLFLVIVLLLVGTGVGVAIYNKSICHSSSKKRDERLADTHAIKRIEFIKSSPGWQNNLVNETVGIDYIEEVLQVQKYLNDRNNFGQNRPSVSWNVDMKIIFKNGDDLIVHVQKINTPSGSTSAYFSFEDACPGEPIYSSTELGVYLERLTGYTGTPYK